MTYAGRLNTQTRCTSKHNGGHKILRSPHNKTHLPVTTNSVTMYERVRDNRRVVVDKQQERGTEENKNSTQNGNTYGYSVDNVTTDSVYVFAVFDTIKM